MPGTALLPQASVVKKTQSLPSGRICFCGKERQKEDIVRGTKTRREINNLMEQIMPGKVG